MSIKICFIFKIEVSAVKVWIHTLGQAVYNHEDIFFPQRKIHMGFSVHHLNRCGLFLGMPESDLNLKGKIICLKKANFTVNWSDHRIIICKVLMKNFAFRNSKKV